MPKTKNDDFYNTANKAQIQIEKLVSDCEPEEKLKLQRYVHPVDRNFISRAKQLDQKIRGQNAY